MSSKRYGQEVPISDWTELEHELPTSENENPLERILTQEKLKFVWSEVEAMPPQMRRCFELRLYDYKYREIADILNVSINSVKSYLFEGTKRVLAAVKMAEGANEREGSR
jgi:DNA-directed RNA polymerase specialized sigma24 family protein